MEMFIKYRTQDVTVPLSERRHRLYSHEIPEILEGLRLRLEVLLEKREDSERAEVAFRALYRLGGKTVGRPKYPEFSWDTLKKYLDQRTVPLS
jgi:hypothetical protein